MTRFTYGTSHCLSCGADVAFNALICPVCGNRNPGHWDLAGLKSAGLLILLVVVGFIPLVPVVIAVAFPFVLAYIIKWVLKPDGSQPKRNSVQCDCGTTVQEPFDGAFQSCGVICPTCGTVHRA